jgi:hypothetical protein
MSTEVAATLYHHLDTFTGGIEQFLVEERDETYRSVAYQPFVCVALGARRVLFGFYAEGGYPDPTFSVTLGAGQAALESLVTDTMLGHRRGPGSDQEEAEYCAEFLQEMIQRKQRGVMTLNHVKRYC